MKIYTLTADVTTDELLRMAVEQKMEEVANEYGANFKIEGNDWQFDHDAETVICPIDWHIVDDTDTLWRKYVLENHADYVNLKDIPQFVLNLYHELGHHFNGNDYEETALRKILDFLAPINKELSLLGYFELVSEQEATDYALNEVQEVANWWNDF